MSQNLMSNLASQYCANLSAKLNNPDGFQVATGSVVVGDQPTLDSVADAIPPTSLNNAFSGNPVNAYSANYGNIINGLVAPDLVSNALGTAYAQSWLTYQQANASALDFTTQATLLASQQALMAKWGVVDGVPSGVVQNGQTALTQEVDNPVTVAVNLWHANQGNPFGFLPQSSDITILFNNPSPISFTIDDVSESTDLSHTWAEGSFGILADIFELGNETSYSQESSDFLSKGFSLKFSCRQVSALTTPITIGKNFQVAGQSYGAWMSMAALQLAYKSPNDATVWQRASDWDKFFGPNGTFKRVITEIFLADDIQLTMSSTYDFSSSDVTKVESAAEGGFWPFFVAEGAGGSSSTITKNEDEGVTATTTSPIGVPILLGVATQDIETLMSSTS